MPKALYSKPKHGEQMSFLNDPMQNSNSQPLHEIPWRARNLVFQWNIMSNQTGRCPWHWISKKVNPLVSFLISTISLKNSHLAWICLNATVYQEPFSAFSIQSQHPEIKAEHQINAQQPINKHNEVNQTNEIDPIRNRWNEEWIWVLN